MEASEDGVGKTKRQGFVFRDWAAGTLHAHFGSAVHAADLGAKGLSGTHPHGSDVAHGATDRLSDCGLGRCHADDCRTGAGGHRGHDDANTGCDVVHGCGTAGRVDTPTFGATVLSIAATIGVLVFFDCQRGALGATTYGAVLVDCGIDHETRVEPAVAVAVCITGTAGRNRVLGRAGLCAAVQNIGFVFDIAVAHHRGGLREDRFADREQTQGDQQHEAAGQDPGVGPGRVQIQGTGHGGAPIGCHISDWSRTKYA